MRVSRGAALAIAAVAVGAGATTSVVAGGEAPGPGQPPLNELTVSADRVASPSAAGPLMRAKPRGGARGLKVIYLETSEPQTLPPGYTGATVKRCPGKSKVLNGYYFARDVHQGFGLDDQGGSPSRVRKWSFYLRNENPTPVTDVILGMICVKAR